MLGIFILLSLAIFIVLRFYEDEIGTYAVKKLKSQVETKFEVGDVGLAFWKTFPNASVELNDVYVEERGDKPDTLLFAQAIYLKFNLWDVFRGAYRVDEVDINGGSLYLNVDAQGKNNWEVWKAAASDTSNFEIELEEISLTDTRVVYNETPSGFNIDLLAIQASGSGNFSSRNMDVEVSLDLFIENLSSEGDVYLEKREIKGEVAMHADLDRHSYVFDPGELACDDFQVVVQGNMNATGNGSLEFTVDAHDQLIEDAMDILPPSVRKSIRGYKATGDCSGRASISRQKENDAVMVEVDMKLSDGTLRMKEEGVALEDIATDFHYIRGGKRDRIQVKSFRCELDGSHIEASGSVVGFESPALDVKISAQVELKDLRDFLDLQQIEVCEGSVTAEAALVGTLRYVEADTSYNWRDILATGQARVAGGSLKMKNSNRLFSDMAADFTFDKQSARIGQFAGKVNGSDFALSGTLHNVVAFLFEPQARVFLDANLKSEVIDFTQLVEEETSTSVESDYELLFPALLDFNLNCSVNKFIFRKFKAEGVRGMVVLNQGTLTVDPVTFATADGKLSAQIVLAPVSSSAYRMNCLANVQGIHIDKLFTEFENFGQTFIQDRHLKGVANANVQFRAVLTNALELPSDKIESVIDLSIENGELNNLETLQEIADYLRNNKLVAPFVDEDRFAEKMRNVKFSKLENVIQIRNRMITIPLMDIRSTAMDISAKGTHTFDHAIDYAVGFNLRDLLVRKEKDLMEEDDGLGKAMYISMKGTVDNPVYAVDRELAKEVRKEAMEAEKQNVKSLLKDELGLFKKDASVGAYKESPASTGNATIQVEWEEENKTNQTLPTEKPPAKTNDKPAEAEKPSDKKKKTPKWLEEKD